jgi:hypothetical protein
VLGGVLLAEPNPGRAARSRAKRERRFGAGNRDRTGDIQLGKLAFYR